MSVQNYPVYTSPPVVIQEYVPIYIQSNPPVYSTPIVDDTGSITPNVFEHTDVSPPIYEHSIDKHPTVLEHHAVEECCKGLNNVLSKCGAACKYVYENIICGWSKCSCTSKDSGKQIILSIVAFICFVICLPIFLTIVRQDAQYVSPWMPTNCQYFNNIVVPRNCCDIINTDSCSSTVVSTPSCISYKAALTPSSGCNNGPYCCNYYCDRCSRTVYDDCNCVTTRDSQGRTVRTCDRCSRVIHEDCNCMCHPLVSNQLAAVACGTCRTIDTVYGFNVSSLGGTTQSITSTTSIECLRDNLSCVTTWLAQHQLNNPVPCWYDHTQPNAGASFSEPKYKKNIAALVFAILFAVTCTIALLWSVYYFKLECNTKQMNDV